MKNLFLIFIFLLFNTTFAQSMLDSEYDFIDSAFDGIKPVTNKEFNDTINKLTPQPVGNTFKDKVRTFLFGRKYGVQPQIQTQNVKIDIGGEKKAIEDIKSGVYYIKLLVSVISNDGRIIPLGSYKIKEETSNNVAMLAFYQGSQKYGELKLKTFEDTLKNENNITYSRVDIISESTVRIVYSTIKNTQCAYAKIAKE